MKDIRQNTIGPILALLASQACSSYVKLLYGASLGTKFWREKETILFIAPCESRGNYICEYERESKEIFVRKEAKGITALGRRERCSCDRRETMAKRKENC